MIIKSKGHEVYLSDPKTRKSAILKMDSKGVWRLHHELSSHVYPDLETAITMAASILADDRETKDASDR